MQGTSRLSLFALIAVGYLLFFLPCVFAEESTAFPASADVSQPGPASVSQPGPCRRAVALVQQAQDTGLNHEVGRPMSIAAETKQKLFEEALSLCPEMPEIRFNYGVFLADRGEQELARDQFFLAKERDDRIEYRLGIARTYLSQSELTEAKKWYDGVLSQEKLHPAALQGLAIVAERSGDIDKAVQLLTQVLSVSGNDPIPYYNLAALYQKREMTDEALEHYRLALERSPEHFPSLYHGALLLVQRGEFSQAASQLEKAAELRPEDSRVFLSLGSTYERMGRLDRAELAFQKALSLDGESALARSNLGLILIKLRKPSQARELYEAELGDTKKLDSDALFTLGIAERELGKYGEAEKFLLEGHKRNLDDKRFLSALVTVYELKGDKKQAEHFQSLLDTPNR